MTPYQALYGYSLAQLPVVDSQVTNVAAVEDFLHKHDQTVKILKENLELAQHRMKQQKDQHRTEREFHQVGDFVYLKLQPCRQSSLAIRRSLRLAAGYFGHYQVIERIGTVAYKLQLPADSRIHPIFHVSLLKKELGTHAVVQTILPRVADEGELLIQPKRI